MRVAALLDTRGTPLGERLRGRVSLLSLLPALLVVLTLLALVFLGLGSAAWFLAAAETVTALARAAGQQGL